MIYLFISLRCIVSRIFIANVSHQHFDQKIIFVNSEPEHKNEWQFCTQNPVLKVRVKDSIQKLIELRFGLTNSINKHLRLYFPTHIIRTLNLKLLLITFVKPNLIQKYLLFT